MMLDIKLDPDGHELFGAVGVIGVDLAGPVQVNQNASVTPNDDDR